MKRSKKVKVRNYIQIEAWKKKGGPYKDKHKVIRKNKHKLRVENKID